MAHKPHATTKDLYTPLHIAAKEGQEEVASVLLDNGADLTATTKKGFTPLHLAAKYGHLNVARLMLQRDAPADAQGKNGVTPLHVAAHYDHQPVALLLLDKGASPHATAKNGHTPLHIAAKKNQMDIATTLLEYGARADAESKAGFTPLHLSSQEGHSDMSSLLLEHSANPNHTSKNGLTPLHLCAQEDRVSVAQLLLRAGAVKDTKTKSGYTPLHIACHQGHINMVRLLIEQGADINPVTSAGYTPLHQAAQQGHVLVINLLLKNKANPNAVTNTGHTALGIANKLGYISVVEELKVVTEIDVITTTTVNIEEKYKVVAPEAMQETFMSDSEDEGGEDPILGDQQQYKYMTVDDMKSLGDDSRMDVTNDEKSDYRNSIAPSHLSGEAIITPAHVKDYYASHAYTIPDNVDIKRQPITVGFLVSFLVDARGGAMRGCRHSGVRVIVPPRCAASPTRITCRYVRPKKIQHPPPLMEGEALASRVLELGPVGAKFLGPVIIEVPHFASLRGKQREIIVLRSDNGETWKEHTLEANEEAVQDVLNHSFEGEELNQIEDLHTSRITRILTNDFPHYFAVVSRVRQDVYAIGPDGGTVSSTAVPLVQAVFPSNALTKKIRVGLQAQAIEPELVSKLLGHGVAVSPIVTVEPRRRKFHKAITLSLPAPKPHTQGMINQYSGFASTLRLLCSITGGQNKAVWEDVTGSTPLSFVKDCVSFTTTVSARFWLMDCRNFSDSARMATELYNLATHVPFMAKFVVFAKRVSNFEARIRVFCMTDDKEDKTLEQQEHFTEIAKSKDIEVLEEKDIFMEFGGNLVPVLQSGDQPKCGFKAFKENRLAFTMRLRDPDDEPVGRIVFMNDPKVARGEPKQTPICTLNLVLPKDVLPERDSQSDLLSLDKDHSYLHHGGISKPDSIHRADFRLSDICNLLESDWEKLASELDIPPSDIDLIKEQYPNNSPQQAMIMFRLWLRQKANKATGNRLESALHKIGRSDIVNKCICNVELVTDDMEKALAKVRLDQSGFDTLKDELGPSRDTSLKRDGTFKLGSQEELDISDKNDFANDVSTEKDLTDTISDFLSHKKQKEDSPTLTEDIYEKSTKLDSEDLHEVVEHFDKLQVDRKALEPLDTSTPPPSPADYKVDNNVDVFKQKFEAANGKKCCSFVFSCLQGLSSKPNSQVDSDTFIKEELHILNQSTPIKEVPRSKEFKTVTKAVEIVPEVDRIEILKKHVNDTLTFLHQERNDFLPKEDIIIPSRKDDHVSMQIDLDSIRKLPSTERDGDEIAKNVRDIVQTELIETIKDLDCENNDVQVDGVDFRNEVESEVSAVIKAAEDAVNELKLHDDQVKEQTDLRIKLNSNANELVNNIHPTQIRIISFDTTSSTTTNDSGKTDKDFDSLTDLSGSFPKDNDTKDKGDEFESLPIDSLKSDIADVQTITDEVGIKHDDSFERVVQEKSAEAFKFLESEISSPSIPTSLDFVEIEPPHKSGIPVAKSRQSKTEKDNDIETLYSQVLERVSSPTEEDLLSKIPISSSKVKVKTIKKHSKDPLKEFVELTKDVNWDDNDGDMITTTVVKSSDPIVKTTVTRITTSEKSVPDMIKSKIPVYNNAENVLSEMSDAKSSLDKMEISFNKSKIPVLVTETTRIVSPDVTHVERTIISPSQIVDTTLVSPGSDRTKTSTKSSTIDSDSDSDSRRSPPLKGILKKSSIRTIGSSSGSDVALHEGGAELSDDDSGRP
ncbi:ankyrin repeat and protein kinase domain-containing protein [Holotrichia oblita]|uniref:Ankyrin repeat and protein kinase domain-containing protein n=1 Tax=Holotrichia oblita TaxID=644536 RepID=A0ACB9TUS6_HOLOL|nr:ankyrin repeat and protein kinase domain-containing protein [Holotrichia oblita]